MDRLGALWSGLGANLVKERFFRDTLYLHSLPLEIIFTVDWSVDDKKELEVEPQSYIWMGMIR